MDTNKYRKLDKTNIAKPIVELLCGMEHSVILGSVDSLVYGIEVDSRRIGDGYVFVAIAGKNSDGHNFISNALQRGANTIIVERAWLDAGDNYQKIQTIMDGRVLIAVQSTRSILSLLVNNFYNFPGRQMTKVGITGTDGKTSVASMLDSTLRQFGLKTAVIGTISNIIAGEEFEYNRTTPTTPDAVELGYMMNEMVHKGVEVMIMEASSMGLKMKREASLQWDLAIFTNLTPEHLDDHKTMDGYKNSKALLFERTDWCIINIDDDFGVELANKYSTNTITYGIDKQAALMATDISFTATHARYRPSTFGKPMDFVVSIATPARFAIYNSLAVLASLHALGVPDTQWADLMQADFSIPGRYELLETKLEQNFSVIVDYAHTAEALRALLENISSNPAYDYIILIFGAGGDRDPSKREPMGRVGGVHAHCSIITNDNPRGEDPLSIIAGIEAGAAAAGAKEAEVRESGDILERTGKGATGEIAVRTGKGTTEEIGAKKISGDESGKEDGLRGIGDSRLHYYMVIPDREEAICRGIKLANSLSHSKPSLRPCVVIAGKGHENYQIIGSKKLDFDDRIVAKKYIEQV